MMSIIKVKNNSTSYPILIGQGVIKHLKKKISLICPETKKIALVFDKKIPKKLKNKVRAQVKSYEYYTYEYSVSERLKSFNKVNALNESLIKKKFNRNDLIIAVGGGVIGDFAGFAASILKRGINFINLPTTLLAQVDSSIGGKTGINSKKGKNLIGTFHQPRLVISETEFLKSLPRREIICGFAEILKHFFISDKKFFNWIKKNTKKLIEDRNSSIIKYAILKSCKIKISFVVKDEKEKRDRAILNFGHTFAHGIESASNFSKKINHGEAVLIGMFLATKLSRQKKICSISTLEQIKEYYQENNLPSSLKEFNIKISLNNIVEQMKSDKKNEDSKISLILLKYIGKTTKPGIIKMSPKQMIFQIRKII